MARTIAGASAGRTNRRFLLLALLLAGVSAVLVYALFARNSGEDGGGGASAGTVPVVVAKTGIKQNTAITSEMVEVKNISEDLIFGVPFEEKDDVVGKVTKFPLEADEPITASVIIDRNSPTTGEALSYVVPHGKRAMAVSADEVQDVGALVLPGDYVDILWVCCNTGGEEKAALIKTVVQNVQVAAIAQTFVDAPPAGEGEDPVAAELGEPDPKAISVTLLLTPDQTHLVFLADLTGDLRFRLRGRGDTALLPESEDYTLATELLPIEVLATLPQALWPDGYKDEQ